MPLTPSMLRAMLKEPKPGESITYDGPIQIGAMQSRNRNGCVRVVMNNVPYLVAEHPDNAQQFYLLPEIGGMTPRHGLSWGYMAFSNAIETGGMRYV